MRACAGKGKGKGKGEGKGEGKGKGKGEGKGGGPASLSPLCAALGVRRLLLRAESDPRGLKRRCRARHS